MDGARKASEFRIQVTTCNPHNVRHLLNREAAFSDEVDDAVLISELLGAVKDKMKYPTAVRRRLILLIDGGLVAFHQLLVTSVLAGYSEDLAAAGFQEIWYTSRTSGQAIQLA